MAEFRVHRRGHFWRYEIIKNNKASILFQIVGAVIDHIIKMAIYAKFKFVIAMLFLLPYYFAVINNILVITIKSFSGKSLLQSVIITIAQLL